MGEACGTYGAEERCIEGFGDRNLKSRDDLKDLVGEALILLKWIFKKYVCILVSWTDLAEYVDA